MASELDIPILTGGQMANNSDRLADSSKIERYVSVLAYWMPKTPDEKIKDTVKGGNYKLQISKNRLGRQHDTTVGEYLNFTFNPSIVKIDIAEIPESNIENNNPY